jgi:hypothetical protein
MGEKFFLTVVVVSCYKNMNPKSVCIAAISAACAKAIRRHGPEGHGDKMLNGLEQLKLQELMK